MAAVLAGLGPYSAIISAAEYVTARYAAIALYVTAQLADTILA